MKKKKLLLAALVLSIGIVSCQKEIVVDSDGLVDVELTTNAIATTKSEVTSGGATTWEKNDEVFVVDANHEPRKFKNNSKNSTSTSSFSGKLLAGKGEHRYYAFHSASKSPCALDKYKLTVSREDLVFHCDNNYTAISKGMYCSMVALPTTFNAENASETKNFNFHHVGCLIEARIATINERFADMLFDKVVFTMTAIDLANEYPEYNNLMPFNTEVIVDMKLIEGDSEDDTKNVSIPYIEGKKKVNRMTSTITYPENTKFSDNYTSGTNYFDIPIYALPTKAKFTYQLDVVFYNSNEVMCHVRKQGKANGLRLAGLNDPNFDDEKYIVIGPRF